MSLWRLIVKEVRLRKINFALGVASVLVAVGVLTAELTLLRAHDLRTGQILAQKQRATEAEMRLLEDDYRKIMKKLGYNLLLLPRGQSLGDFHDRGYAAGDMPETHVTTLAQSGLATIQHLLPSLERKIRWPEQGGRTIVLVGTRGEVPQAHMAAKEPMEAVVPPGRAVLGHEIWRSLDLRAGDTITILGERFRVSALHPERGNSDDIAIWVDLRQAQRLLGRPGRISSILALKCECAGSDLPTVRKDIGRILPGVQVIELANLVVTRTEARARAAAAARTALEAERAHRTSMRREREAFAAWLLPLVTLGAAAWIGLLALMNVRERKPEIGILRALGVPARRIMAVFLVRALLVGAMGGALGYAAGYAVGLLSGEAGGGAGTAGALVSPLLLVAAILAAPLFTALASLPPALLAARQDPALVLREG